AFLKPTLVQRVGTRRGLSAQFAMAWQAFILATVLSHRTALASARSSPPPGSPRPHLCVRAAAQFMSSSNI
ncbi:MAG: hypothetical protein E6447_21475, partial [Bradyrhizobium sp.]|nr:hypothetical protein [Bradyrhizobium sp.]